MKFHILIIAVVLFSRATFARRTPRIAGFKDCNITDPTTIIAHFNGTFKTDPVLVPGEGEFDISLRLDEETGDKVNVQVTTFQIKPDGTEVRVPCLGNGISGSCSTIPLCQLLNQFEDIVCPIFPPELPCGCPLPRGTFTVLNASIPFSEVWLNEELLPDGPNGDYRGIFELTSSALPTAPVLGCLEILFTLEARSK